MKLSDLERLVQKARQKAGTHDPEVILHASNEDTDEELQVPMTTLNLEHAHDEEATPFIRISGQLPEEE